MPRKGSGPSPLPDQHRIERHCLMSYREERQWKHRKRKAVPYQIVRALPLRRVIVGPRPGQALVPPRLDRELVPEKNRQHDLSDESAKAPKQHCVNNITLKTLREQHSENNIA